MTFTEKLTLEKIDNDASQCKGKAFNRMIVAGLRGLYISEEKRKMKWGGVPRIAFQPHYI